MGVFELASGFQIWDGAISYVRGVSELENLIDSDSDPVVDSGLIYTPLIIREMLIFLILLKEDLYGIMKHHHFIRL